MAPTVSFVSSFHQQLFNRLKAGSETSNDSINLTDNCVGSLLYNIKGFETAVLVIWCYINEIELKFDLNICECV